MWSAALKDTGDILLYGCDVAANAAGQGLVEEIHALTGRGVAASTDDTGSAALGGDWKLEFNVGHIDTAVPFSTKLQAAWNHVLNIYDLATNGSSATIGPVLFGQTNQQSSRTASTFLGIQKGGGIEQAYNTNATLTSQFLPDTTSKASLLFSAIPQIEIGGVIYREIALDVAQSRGAGGIALNDLRLYSSNVSTLQNYDSTAHTLGGVAPFYDLDSTAWGTGDNTILVYDQNMARPDLLIYVPESSFFLAPNTPP